MLTRLSIRFPDRVPKIDHDKILKDRFLCGIKAKLHNSIRHLYDDESVTFPQLLVKAHRNEEEETTSKLVNKNVMIDNDSILEQRVDRLIAKSNTSQGPQPLLVGIITKIMDDLHFNPVKGLGEIIQIIHHLDTHKEI